MEGYVVGMPIGVNQTPLTVPFPSCIGVIGMQGTGKSSAIKWLMYYLALNKQIDVVYIFSDLDPSEFDWNDSRCICQGYSAEAHKKIIQSQDEAVTLKKTRPDLNIHVKRVVVVFDDSFKTQMFLTNQFEAAVAVYRHTNTMYVFSAQYPFQLSPMIRGSLSIVLIFSTYVVRAITELYNTWGCQKEITMKEFQTRLKKLPRYGFLFFSTSLNMTPQQLEPMMFDVDSIPRMKINRIISI